MHAVSGRLVIFDTHPIQYRAPVFAALARTHAQLKVYFFEESFDARRWWFQEVGKTPPQNFRVSLRDGYSSQILGTKNWSLRWKWARLNAVIKEEKPSAVLIYGYYLPEHWVLWALCRWHRIPLLFVGESFDWKGSGFRRWVKQVLISRFFGHVTTFLSIGEKNRDYYREWGIPEEKIISAHYCTDPAFFQVDEATAERYRQEFRKTFQISPAAFVVLFVGRLFSRKRPEDVLAFHEQIRRRYPEVVTVIAGNGEMEAVLKSRMTAGIIFTGFRDQSQIREAYYGADLLYVPSEYETWGLVVNEAFSCGRPALVTETCGVAGDLVVENETGAVVPVGDVSAAVQKVSEWISNPERFRRMGIRARERVLAGYTPLDFAESVLKAFYRAVGNDNFNEAKP